MKINGKDCVCIFIYVYNNYFSTNTVCKNVVKNLLFAIFCVVSEWIENNLNVISSSAEILT